MLIPSLDVSLSGALTGSQSVAVVRAVLVVLLTGLLGGGCASQQPVARYNASKNETTYKTRFITVVDQLSERGYGDSSSIIMQGRARCRGQNCTPNVVRLMFSVSGNTEVGFQDRSITIVADGETYTWEDQMPLRKGNVQRMVTVGPIGGVRLRLATFATIVNATSVSGSVGGRTFEVDERGRAELKRFLKTMRTPSASQGSGS